MKRALDVVLSLLLLIALAPLLFCLALAVRLRLGTPVIFRQVRPGLRGQPFKILKFRTMTNKTDANGVLLSDEARLTSFGVWLRSTSLDELPELLNVVRGEMSLVGPRPLLPEYLPLYSSEQMRRHDVRPGLTGLAQISGRNELDWAQRLQLDVWYVDNHTTWLDMMILARTIARVVRRDGISQPGHATSARFDGRSD